MASILVCAPLAGCGTEKIEQETPQAQSTAVQEEQPPAEEKVLVVYFSATGNTNRAAGIIAEATGGTQLAELAAAGDWREGKRFSSSASEEEILEWIQSLEF